MFLGTIVTCRFDTLVFSFPLLRKELKHDPAEFPNKKHEVFSHQ